MSSEEENNENNNNNNNEQPQYSDRVQSWARRQPDGGLASRPVSQRTMTNRASSLISIPEGSSADPNAANETLFSGTSSTIRRTASTNIGDNNNIRMSIVPINNNNNSRRTSFAPKRLLDIENGKSLVIYQEPFLSPLRYQELGPDGVLVVKKKQQHHRAARLDKFEWNNNNTIQQHDSQIGTLGWAWRRILLTMVLFSLDDVNAARINRALQIHLSFLSAYESHIVMTLIRALDDESLIRAKQAFQLALSNRNVSRIVVRIIRARFDFVWHVHTQLESSRLFDAFGNIPFIGITNFPPTENVNATRNHALASIFRILLGPGNWITRIVTSGREGLITSSPNLPAQNITPESNGFEWANRSQYGTYVGRKQTTKFRLQHKFPIDPAVIRTFTIAPFQTLISNGVVHVLRMLNKHWRNTLKNTNFWQITLELLDPFETLRARMPVVLLVLSSLRGRRKWDSRVLGRVVRRCQELRAGNADSARAIVCTLLDEIVLHVSGGIAAILDPLKSWIESIQLALDQLEQEAEEVAREVSKVELGIRLGHELMARTKWPSEQITKRAILDYIKTGHCEHISPRRIEAAMQLVAPRDKRTLVELVRSQWHHSQPAKLLLRRLASLLERELRRDCLNECIENMSMGEQVSTPLIRDEWYWMTEHKSNNDIAAVYRYDAKVTGRDVHRFIHVDSGYETFVKLNDVNLHHYIPVAEAITRAQKVFMNMTLHHGKTFTYAAFSEFGPLRTPLLKLAVVGQVSCQRLDNARLNLLKEIQHANNTQLSIRDLEPGSVYYRYDGKTKQYLPFTCQKKYDPSGYEHLGRAKITTCPPQSVIQIGGGPSGLLSVIHCTENVLHSGGAMKLYEARDAFRKGGATFERAQIVRLDPRWVAMMRYHLGTGFEDGFLPITGETDAQLGNTIPGQGFVEMTIKDLENILHVEVSKLWSKGLIQVHTDSRAQYDPASNSLTKLGEHLKMDDLILRFVDENGNADSSQHHSWKVVDLVYTKEQSRDSLILDREYGIYVRNQNAVLPFKLVGIVQDDDDEMTFTFRSLSKQAENFEAPASKLPAIYPKGTTVHGEVSKVVVESVKKGSHGGYTRHELSMDVIKKQKFTIDVGHTHVVEAIGKPHNSKVHFGITTLEPYAVCCMQGLKVSMGMHNFGETRWGAGILDDIRSQTDQNTRIVGDFQKMVRQATICERMRDFVKTQDWMTHLNNVVADSHFSQINDMEPIVPKIIKACDDLAREAPTFHRQTLQTRFFETGDNYYLGMELTREYDRWKNMLAEDLVAPLLAVEKDKKQEIYKFKGVLAHHIDRLWFDGCLETIRFADVYNPGAKWRVPRLYLINSNQVVTLGTLPVGESFRLDDRPEEKYEVVIRRGSRIIARNVEGFITKFKKSTKVRRESNLTRSPDGNTESRVALASFPVGLYVNHRCLRLNDSEKGYVFASIGDEQATPHFMRYSGLTGAGINVMLFNQFLGQAIDGVPFEERIRMYSMQTDWSNGEVVTRGAGSNFGEDGFLRPGFSYAHGIDYLRSKVIEHRETGRDAENILSPPWKAKFAASLVPRGMELNEEFVKSLESCLQAAIFDKFLFEVMADKKIASDSLESALRARHEAMKVHRDAVDYERYWVEFMRVIDVDETTKEALEDRHVFVAKRLEQVCAQVIDAAKNAHRNNARISSELFNQPKPVDSIIDDFAVDAQAFGNALTRVSAIASGVMALSIFKLNGGEAIAIVIALFNINIAFGTLTNVSRYKIRNEEARIVFADEKFPHALKAVFSLLDRKTQDSYPAKVNPFIIELDKQVAKFSEDRDYYDCPDKKEFDAAYANLKKNINDPNELEGFMKMLTTKFIVDTYHVNSYLQEDLVNIYKSCHEMVRLLTLDVDKTTGGVEAKRLFDRLNAFCPKLESSLQRLPVYWGFLKKRKFLHWDIMVTIRYFYSLIWYASPTTCNPIAPIQTETRGIVKQAKHLSRLHNSTILRRNIRDLETLYWATRESDVASLIFMAGFLAFFSSIVFSIARIFNITVLEMVAFWSTAVSSVGAILAVFHKARKLCLLMGLCWVIGIKSLTAPLLEDRKTLARVRNITVTQMFATACRLLSALCSAIALPWSVGQAGFDSRINTAPMFPVYFAIAAVLFEVIATIFFLGVELGVRYNLAAKLGEFVCEGFGEELEGMRKILELPLNDIQSTQVQERETWEYVAREFLHQYRFDTVFAPDRFGTIMQYIQGGMDSREE